MVYGVAPERPPAFRRFLRFNFSTSVMTFIVGIRAYARSRPQISFGYRGRRPFGVVGIVIPELAPGSAYMPSAEIGNDQESQKPVNQGE